VSVRASFIPIAREAPVNSDERGKFRVSAGTAQGTAAQWHEVKRSEKKAKRKQKGQKSQEGQKGF
jgi:hypothetical protein